MKGRTDMRVLILFAKIGGGHMRAAQALEAVIKERNSDAVVEVVDGLEYANHYVNKMVVDGYKISATKFPRMYGMIYHAANTDTSVYKFMQKANSHLAKKFIPLLAEFKPDIVVTTHAFMSIMVSRLREKGITNVPLISIVTDFAPHASYINPCVDQFVVSSVQMVDEFEQLGVDRSIVHPIGIPIAPVFFEKDEKKEEHLAELGFDPKLQTVLVMAGSFGVTDILKIYKSINEIELDFQIIVITGKNQKLFDAFNSILSCNEDYRAGKPELNFDDDKEPSRKEMKFNVTKKTKLIYFTDEVEKYMHISDLIITKPGGLTVTESLASCLPMALFKGIPGQETSNTEYLCNNNLAISIKKSNTAEVIYQLLKYPDRLLSMKESCSRLNNKESAYKVYEIIESSVENMTEPLKHPSLDDTLDDTIDSEDEDIYSELSQVIGESEEKYDELEESEWYSYVEEKLHHIKEKMKEKLKIITNHDFSSKKDEE